MSHTIYKALRTGQHPTHAHDADPWVPGDWREVTGELVPCENGLHLCRSEAHLLEWLSDEVWVAEIDDTEVIDAGDKIVVRRARIIEQTAWCDRIARLFAADCAERVLPIFECERPGDDRPRLAIKAARDYANGAIDAAAWDAAWDAAWAAARDAARAAARDAAGDAARAAAWAAAWAAAGAAAGDAAGDAEREWQAQRLRQYLTGEAS